MGRLFWILFLFCVLCLGVLWCCVFVCAVCAVVLWCCVLCAVVLCAVCCALCAVCCVLCAVCCVRVLYAVCCVLCVALCCVVLCCEKKDSRTTYSVTALCVCFAPALCSVCMLRLTLGLIGAYSGAHSMHCSGLAIRLPNA